MSTSVYQINKGINRPIEFRGLKAQYIGYLAAGLLILLVLFALLYISGIQAFICLALILSLGSALFLYVYYLSRRYGAHGMMKKMARSRIPRIIKSRTRQPFLPQNKTA